MSKCPWCPNVHDVQMSMFMLSHLSYVVTLVTGGQTCHMWSHLSNVVTTVTFVHTCHMWWHLSNVVTIVTCCHTCDMWSHLSHEVTLVTYGHTCHMWSNLTQGTNVSTADKKVCSLSHDETRPTYRPARMQVKQEWTAIQDLPRSVFFGFPAFPVICFPLSRFFNYSKIRSE